jgi:8-oxo-dGTP diphosphatase
MTAFATTKLRTAAAVICEQHVVLIQRVKGTINQFTLPGGNVEPGEPLYAALRRELREELGLDLKDAYEPDLVAVQDQMVSRPGATPAPRKLHLVFRVPISVTERDNLATVEHDDLTDGAVVWVPLAHVADLHLFPAVGEVLARLDANTPSGAILMPALTDRNFQWI